MPANRTTEMFRTYLDPAIIAAIKDQAAKERRTIRTVVETALTNYLKEQE